MKKIVAFCLSALIFSSLFFVSCSKNEIVNPSDLSSNFIYVETSSTIAKTESDGDYTFNFDPFVLSQQTKNSLKSISLYKKFINAVLNNKESVEIPTRDDYDNIRFAMGEFFPFTNFIEGYRYDSQNNKILITYKESKKNAEKITAFKDAVQEVFDECVKTSDDDVIAALNIYKWLAQNVDIVENVKIESEQNNNESNISITETAQNVSSKNTSSKTEDDQNDLEKNDIYSALIDKKANSQSISSLYGFLLLQLGIDCNTVSAWIENQGYHTWNMIYLNNKWYSCDLTYEIKKTQGEGLKFFGMTKENIESYIFSNEIYTGVWKWFTDKLPKANSKRFESFRSVNSWTLLDTRNGIEAYTDEYSRFMWNIYD